MLFISVFSKFLFNLDFISFDILKKGTFFSGIVTFSPVRGFFAIRAFLDLTLKTQ